MKNTITRREIIKRAALGFAATGITPKVWSSASKNGIPLRTLGKTGEKVPMLALGGHHMGRIDDDRDSYV